MAIRLIDRYPSRANPATTQYPHGSGRNKSDPTADDGTPFDQDRFNDQEAFFQGLLERAGITPSGVVDTVQASDYLDALRGSLIADSLVDLQAFPTQYAVDGYIMQTVGRSAFGDGGEGHFRWDSSNLSTEVGNDEVTANEGDGGIYVAPASDKTGASGAWVRQYNVNVQIDWYGADATGATDSVVPVQKAVNAVAGTGHSAVFSEGRYKLSSRVTVNGLCSIRGQGFKGNNYGSGQALADIDIVGTQIHVDFTPSVDDEAFFVESAGVSFHDMEFVYDQTLPTASWSPETTPWAIHAYRAQFASTGADHFKASNIMVLNLTHGIWLDGLQQYFIDGLYGQAFDLLIKQDEISDVGRTRNVHHWPFWSGSNDVKDYTVQNCAVIESLRNDNPHYESLFGIYVDALILFSDGATGATSRFHIVNSEADGANNCLKFDASGVTGQFANLTHHGYLSTNAVTQERGIWFTPSSGGCRVSGANFRSSKAGAEAIKVEDSGTANRIMIDGLEADEWNDSGSSFNALQVDDNSEIIIGRQYDFFNNNNGGGYFGEAANGKLQIDLGEGFESLSTDSNGDAVITHGLIVDPRIVQLSYLGDGTARIIQPSNVSSTEIRVKVFDAAGAAITNAGPFVFYWSAKY